MFHDHRVVLPIVGVIGKDLKFWIRDVPILIWGCFIEDRLEFRLREETFFRFSVKKGRLAFNEETYADAAEYRELIICSYQESLFYP